MNNPDNRWHAITHQIFEVPNQKGGLLDRLKVLQDYLKTQPNTPIHHRFFIIISFE
jgi:DNA ligase-1